MTKVDENIAAAQHLLNGIVEKCYELEKKNKQLQNMINTAIGISYNKDEEEAIKYLENEKNHYPNLFDN